MAGHSGLRLGGMIEDMRENVLAKEFLGSVNVHQGQVGGPQVLLLAHGDEIDPNLGILGPLDMTANEVTQPIQGGQGQVGVPQLSLLGHRDEIETPNWACRDY